MVPGLRLHSAVAYDLWRILMVEISLPTNISLLHSSHVVNAGFKVMDNKCLNDFVILAFTIIYLFNLLLLLTLCYRPGSFVIMIHFVDYDA